MAKSRDSRENINNQPDILEEIQLTIGISSKDIGYFNSIFESYEGIAIVSTSDAKEAKIKILTTSYFLPKVLHILDEMKKEGNGWKKISCSTH